MIEAGGGVPLKIREQELPDGSTSQTSNLAEMKKVYMSNLEAAVKNNKFNFPAYGFTKDDLDTLDFMYHMHAAENDEGGKEGQA